MRRSVIVSKCLFMIETHTESQQLMDGIIQCCHDRLLMRPRHKINKTLNLLLVIYTFVFYLCAYKRIIYRSRN